LLEHHVDLIFGFIGREWAFSAANPSPLTNLALAN